MADDQYSSIWKLKNGVVTFSDEVHEKMAGKNYPLETLKLFAAAALCKDWDLLEKFMDCYDQGKSLPKFTIPPKYKEVILDLGKYGRFPCQSVSFISGQDYNLQKLRRTPLCAKTDKNTYDDLRHEENMTLTVPATQHAAMEIQNAPKC